MTTVASPTLDEADGDARPRSPALTSRLRMPPVWVSLLSITFGLVLWEIAVPLFDLNSLIIAPPSDIFVAFGDLIEDGSLWRDFRISMNIFAVGFGIAAAVGVVTGVAIGQFRVVRAMLEPWITALYATPNIALAPLFIIWLGYGYTTKVTTVAYIATFPVVINTIAGVDAVLTEWRDVGSAFRASAWERFTKINIPGALPSIFVGLRLGIGRGLVGIVVADFFGASDGLGYLILRSAQSFRTANIFVGTFTLAFVGVVLVAVIRVVERFALPQRRHS